jgi:hypothetical protein
MTFVRIDRDELEEVHRVPICQLHMTGNWLISFGISIDVKTPNIEIHLPACFLRIGFCKTTLKKQPIFIFSSYWDEEEDFEHYEILG